jgi:hypothetical protein
MAARTHLPVPSIKSLNFAFEGEFSDLDFGKGEL